MKLSERLRADLERVRIEMAHPDTHMFWWNLHSHHISVVEPLIPEIEALEAKIAELENKDG